MPLILFGDHIAAYGVVRALGPYGMPIYIVSANGNGVTTRSRYVKDVLSLPADTIDFCAALRQWGLKKVGKDAVLIVAGSDDYLDVLSQHHDDLPKGWHPTFPSWSIVQNVRQKHRTFGIAERVGLPVPRTTYIDNKDDFDRFVAEGIDARWPLILKPEHSAEFLKQHGTKGFVCKTLTELKTHYDKYGKFAGGFLIQEFIPGPEGNLVNFIGIYNQDADPLYVFVNRKKRSSGPLLSCTLMETDWSEPAIKYSNRLIKAIGYYGYANVEFKLDSRNSSLNLMEINGRVSMSNSHALLCGMNLPLGMYREAIGQHHTPSENFPCSYGKNILWWLPLEDLAGVRNSKEEDFSWIDYLRSLKGRKIIEPFNARDPFPGVFTVLSFTSRVARKFFKVMSDRLNAMKRRRV